MGARSEPNSEKSSISVKNWWRSLRFWLPASGVVALLLLFAMLSYTTYRALHTFALASVRSAIVQTSTTLDVAIAPHMTREGIITIQEHLDSLIKGEDNGLEYVALLDETGKVVAHSKDTPKNFPDSNVDLDDQIETGFVHVRDSIELPNKMTGQLRYGLAASALHETMHRVVNQNLVALVMVVVPLLGLLVVVGIRVSRQLGELVKASQTLAAGDFSQRVPEAGVEELALLGHNFNVMANAVAERTTLMERQQVELEEAQALAKTGSWHLDLKSQFYTLSAESARIFHVSPGELVSQERVLGWIHPADRERVLAAQRAAMGGAPYDEDFRIIVAGGEEKWVRSRAVNRTDDLGNVVSAVGTVQDISERKYAEEALKQSEIRFRTMFDSSPDPVWIIDENRFVDCNQAAVDVLGYPDKETLRNTHPAALSPKVQPDGEDSYKKAERILAETREKGILRFEWMHTRANGDNFMAEITLSSVILQDKSVLYCVWRDITERKRIEEELAQHRLHLEELVEKRTADLQTLNRKLQDTQFAMESVGMGIQWVHADTGQFMYVNQNAAKMLDYSVDELLELGMPDIDPAFRARPFREATWPFRKENNVRFETLVRRKSGSTFPAEIAFYFLPESSDAPARFITFIEDITPRKESELALVIAKEAAVAANVAKSSFIANMSHEIRTPLNAITGMAYLIRQSGVPPQQVDRLEKIDAAGRHLLEIINDVLDLSKIESGKFALEESDLGVEAIVANVRSMLSDRANAKNLRFVVEAAPITQPLLGDATRVTQALLNLASNAVKFTHAGQITLRTSLLEDSETSMMVRFDVEDTGIGISQDRISSLFAPFEQLDSSITREYGGTGLGLVITKKLARLMGGDVGVRSIPQVGSTFWFTVRLRKGQHARAPGLHQRTESAEATLRRNHRGRRILLAEDEPINREMTSELLQDVGLVIDAAEDGVDAVGLAELSDYDLILMDMQMPKMDGLEATRRIRQSARGAATPVLAMTANAFAEDKARCFEAGMNDFIVKPVEPEALFSVLVRWLARDSTRAPGHGLEAVDPVEELRARLSEIDGLNLEYGLAIQKGNVQKFRRTLRQFVDRHCNDMAMLSASIASGDRAGARHLVHTLKGAAGTLGLKLQQTAAALEAAVLEGRGFADLSPLIDAIASEQAHLATAVAAMTADEQSKVVADPVRAEAALQELEVLLAMDDARADGAYQAGLPLFRASLEATLVDQLAGEIEEYDFPAALLTVRQARAVLEAR
jgi:PAS domain S-box-containing protein